MNSDDQKFRNVMMREIRKVRPLFASGVETDDEMQKYHVDFHTRSIRQMQNFQDKHRVVFCKACPEREKYGRRLYRKLCINFEADLLGNIERVLNVECFKCGFNMLMPAEQQDFVTAKVDEFEWNRVRGAFNELHLDRDVPLDMIFHALQQCAHEYEMKYNQRNMTAQEVQYRQHEMEQRMRQMQGSMASPDRSRGLGGMEHSADAMRYLFDSGALSSAPTVKAKPPVKKKKK